MYKCSRQFDLYLGVDLPKVSDLWSTYGVDDIFSIELSQNLVFLEKGSMVQLSHRLCARNLHPQAPWSPSNWHEPPYALHSLANWPHKGVRHCWVPQKKSFSTSMWGSANVKVWTLYQQGIISVYDMLVLILYTMILLPTYLYSPENHHEKQAQQGSMVTSAKHLWLLW